MTKSALFFALAISMLGALTPGRAAPIFDTATGSPLLSGLVVNDYFWPTHRFEITSSTVLRSVGGFFDGSMSAGLTSIFGAVTALSGSTDFPDSLDLSTADVVGATVFDVMQAANVYSGSLQLTLTPGWYALTFGTGKFGADSAVGVEVIMPSLAIDLDPQLPFTAIQAANPFGTPPQFRLQAASPEFFATPEPATLLLLAVALVAYALSGWGKLYRSRGTDQGVQAGIDWGQCSREISRFHDAW